MIDNKTDNINFQYFFFPFTHITESDLNTLLTFFPQFHFLSISNDLKDRKILNKLSEQKKVVAHFIPFEILVLVEKKFQQYYEWAEINKSNKGNLKILLKENPYFTNNSDITAIKSYLKNSKKVRQDSISEDSISKDSISKDSTPENSRGQNNLLNDLLFLKMAQIYDEQHENIDLELEQINKNCKELVLNLRGIENFEVAKDADYSMDSNNSDFESRTILIQKRIAAWYASVATLKIINKEDTNVLFVTTNKDFFSYFESNCKNIVNILDIDNIKLHKNRCKNSIIWHNQFKNYLMDVVNKNSNNDNILPELHDDCTITGHIKIGNFSNGNIDQNIFNISNKQISVCLIELK